MTRSGSTAVAAPWTENSTAVGGREPIFFYVHGDWYKGRLPTFYDPSDLPATRILEDNFSVIKEEIESFYAAHPGDFAANYTPYAYREEGWRTVNLYSYFLRYHRSCERLPRLDEIVRTIPGMSLVQVGVLLPHTRLKAHFGDTSAIIRSHLGITIPGKLPEVGLRVGREVRGWEEGRVLSFCNAHRHFAWNDTDRPRIALIVDVMRDEHMRDRYAIAAKALAAMVTKALATRYPRLKRTPAPLTTVTHRGIGVGFRLLLAAQRRFGIPIGEMIRER